MRLFEQMREGESELKGVQGENRQLRVQREKNEQTLRQLEKEAEAVGRQERQARDEWNNRIREVERMVQERRAANKQVIEQLGGVNQEIAQLKVQSQTVQYKIEYQQALREMHDNNQYDYRIKKLHGDIEASQTKAQALEEELTLMCDNWELHFDESVR